MQLRGYNVPMLVATLKEHLNNQELCHVALSALAGMLSIPEGRNAIVNADADCVLAIMAVLKRYQNNQKLSHVAVSVLMDLAKHRPDQHSIIMANNDLVVIQDAINSLEVKKKLRIVEKIDLAVAALNDLSNMSDEQVEVRCRSIVKDMVSILEKFENNPIMYKKAINVLAIIAKTLKLKGAQVSIDSGDLKVIVEAMQKFPGSKYVCKKVCLALENIANQPRGINAIVAANGVTYIVESLTKYKNHKSVCILALAALANIAKQPVGVTAIVDSGGLPAIEEALINHTKIARLYEDGCFVIVEVLTKYKNDTRVCAPALVAFENIANQPRGINAIVAANGVTYIVEALTKYKNHKSVCILALAALANIAKQPVGVTAIVDAGGLVAIEEALINHTKIARLYEDGCLVIVEALTKYKNHKSVCAPALAALANIAKQPVGVTAIVGTGGLPAIDEALEKHTKNEKLYEDGCLVILEALIKYKNDTRVCAPALAVLANIANQPRGVNAIVAANGVTYIIEALTNYKYNTSVCAPALAALVNIAKQPGGVTAIVDAGGLAAIKEAFKKHTKNEKLYEDGCFIIVKALRNHEDDKSVCAPALAALANIANQPRAVKAIVDAYGVKDIIVEALRNHKDDKKVCLEACRVLAIIARTYDGRRAIVKAGGVVNIVAALNKYLQSVEVCKQACFALLNIAYSPIGRFAIVAVDDSVAALVAALQEYPESVVCGHASYTLEFLAENQIDAFKKIAEVLGTYYTSKKLSKKVCLVILKGLRNHKVDKKVCSQALAALANIARQPEGVTAIVDAGGLAAIEEALEKHTKNEKLYEDGCLVIVEALIKYKDDKSVCAPALAALANISGTEYGCVKITDCDGVEFIKLALQKYNQEHNTDVYVCIAACRVLANISSTKFGRKEIHGADSGAVAAAIVDALKHSNNKNVCEEAYRALFYILKYFHSARNTLKIINGLKAINEAFEKHPPSQPRAAESLQKMIMFSCNGTSLSEARELQSP